MSVPAAAVTTQAPLVRARDLHKRYGTRHAVRGIDLDIAVAGHYPGGALATIRNDP